MHSLVCLLQLQWRWTADGPITVHAPKVVAVAFKPERAPILRRYMEVPAVKARRVRRATREPAQVWTVDVD